MNAFLSDGEFNQIVEESLYQRLLLSFFETFDFTPAKFPFAFCFVCILLLYLLRNVFRNWDTSSLSP